MRNRAMEEDTAERRKSILTMRKKTCKISGSHNNESRVREFNNHGPY